MAEAVVRMESMFKLFKLLYFVMFAGLGVLMPYMPVYFEILDMSKSQIGVLSMVPNLCSFFLAPLFGIVGDIFNAHTLVLVFGMISSVVLTLAMLSASTFTPLICIVFAASALRAPVTPQVDALVINSLPDKSKYGEMRLWGAVSFGIFAFLGGFLTQKHTVVAFRFNFIAHAVTFLIAAATVIYVTRNMSTHSTESKDSDVPKAHVIGAADVEAGTAPKGTLMSGLGQVFARHPSVVVFSMIVFLSGVGTGIIDAFLFLRLKQLGGSGLVMGLSRFITCAAEVPMFHVAGRLQKKYGTWKMLAVTQVAFVLRFTYYSFLTEPWAVLPCEVLHGLTFAVMWSVSCTYANMISPPECHSTMQALLEGLHWGFGSGVGALVGGFVYDNYGAVWLFEMSALLSLLSLVLAVLAYLFAAPDHEDASDEYSSVPLSTDTEFGLADDDEEVLFTRVSVGKGQIEMKKF